MMLPTPTNAPGKLKDQSLAFAQFKPSSALDVDVDQDRTMEHLERATPLRLIGTFENLVSTYADEPVTMATAKARPYCFDFLPVRERQSDAIVGLLTTRIAGTRYSILGFRYHGIAKWSQFDSSGHLVATLHLRLRHLPMSVDIGWGTYHGIGDLKRYTEAAGAHRVV